jgi:hypothetical protein
MTYSVKQQLARVRKLRRHARPPRLFVVVVEEGEDIPEDIRRQARPEDVIILREVPKHWMWNEPNF